VRFSTVLVSAALLFACSSPSGTSSAQQDGAFSILARTGIWVTSANGGLFYRLAPTAGATALPNFTSAFLEAQSASVLPSPATVTVLPATFDSTGLCATSLTSSLMPASDLNAYAFLTDGQGRLLGSGLTPSTTVKIGANIVLVPITANGAQAQLIGNDSNVNVSDGTVLPNINLDFTTGYQDAQPGVDHVDLTITGPAYGNGTESALISSFKAPSLSNFTWKPQVSTPTYDSTKLANPSSPAPFTLSMKAVDPFGHVVGTNQLNLHIIANATVTFQTNPSPTPSLAPGASPTPTPSPSAGASFSFN
jgi:hypothetical protein